MTRGEWIELVLICAVAASSWLVPSYFLSDLTFGEMVLYASGLLLAQGLVRDIAILLRNREPMGANQDAQCLCLESAIGVTGVIVGSVLFGSANSTPVAISDLGFFVTVAGTLALGFLIKDLVISWNPFGVRRERNHLNVIVRWPRK